MYQIRSCALKCGCGGSICLIHQTKLCSALHFAALLYSSTRSQYSWSDNTLQGIALYFSALKLHCKLHVYSGNHPQQESSDWCYIQHSMSSTAMWFCTLYFTALQCKTMLFNNISNVFCCTFFSNIYALQRTIQISAQANLPYLSEHCNLMQWAML